MGKQIDGTVIPTPRDRVMAANEERAYHLIGQSAEAFEIWTTDQEIYTGDSIEAWNDCPGSQVQWMMVRLPDGRIWEITGVEEYKFGRGNSRIKVGPWMDDEGYFLELPEYVRGTSKLL